MTALGDIEYRKMDGSSGSLSEYDGDVLLVVNVASKCGLTPQYTGLQQLYTDKQDDGFTILAFPANNFGGQEPGTDDEIAEFCSLTYDVKFPMFAKVSVVGDDQHPLYRELTSSIPSAEGADAATFRETLRGHGMTPTEDPDILWNFEKFLIGKDGNVVARFAPAVAPDDPTLVAAIDTELTR